MRTRWRELRLGPCTIPHTQVPQAALLVRPKETYDGAIPSGNSVAMLNMLRLSRITADVDLEEKAARIGRAFSRRVKSAPSAHTQLMVALDFAVGPSYEIVVSGDSKAEDTRSMLRALRERFIPNKVVILRPAEQDSPEIDAVLGFLKDYPALVAKRPHTSASAIRVSSRPRMWT